MMKHGYDRITQRFSLRNTAVPTHLEDYLENHTNTVFDPLSTSKLP